MRTIAPATVGIVLAAIIATYIRYQSFDPCAWMEQDLASQSGLPRLVVKARIQTRFLIHGITDPDVGQCIMAWWELRSDGLLEGS